jgi:putative peptidoglycan lipid II flippase
VVPQRLRTAILSVAWVVFVSKILGFLRGIVIADKFGTSAQYDLYLIAVMLPALASGVLGYACYYQFVPYLTRKAQLAGSERTDSFWRSTWSAVNLTMLMGLGTTLAIVLLAPYVMKIWGADYSPSDFDLIVFYSRVTAAAVLLSVSEAFMRALLNVKKSFAYPAAAGLVGGLLIQNLYLTVRLLPLKSLKHFKPTVIDKESPLFLSVAGTLILIELINRSYFLIDRYFAPSFGEGVISALNYGQVLVQLPESIVGFAIGAVLFPIFSKAGDTSQTESFTVAYRKGITAALLFAVPLGVFFYLNAESLVYFVFRRGAFDDQSVAMTAAILKTLAPAIIALFIVSTSIRACYARGWAKPVLVFAGLMLFTKFAATALISRWMGYPGISLATSVSHVGFGLGLMGYIVMKWSPQVRNRFAFTLVRLFSAGCVIYVVAYAFRRLTLPAPGEMTHTTAALMLAGSAAIVFGSYAATVWLLGFRRYFTEVVQSFRFKGKVR